jgi:uncharacterized membrane protein (DUF4010 family)
MFLRVFAIVLAINAALLPLVAAPLLAAAVSATGYAVYSACRRGPDGADSQAQKFRNPFGFWTVIGFALFLGAVIVAGRAIGQWLGAAGAIVGAAIVGLVDVDAITVSMARLAPATLTARDAATAILVAVATDTISKIGIGAAIGGGRFAIEISIMAALSLIAAAVAAWVGFAMLQP